MSAAEHDRYEDDVGAFLLGALPTGEHEAFERHLAGCHVCQDELDRLRAADAEPLGKRPSRLRRGRRVAVNLLHQSNLQRLRRLVLLHRARQRVGRRGEPLELVLADVALGEVALERLRLVLGQRAEHVDGHVLLVALVLAGAHASSPLSWLRSLSSPSRIRPFTVPIGIDSISAIWLWVKPPK